MAYLAFNEIGGAVAPRGSAPARPASPAATGDGTLTALEWAVVRIARNDSRRSLRAPDWKSGVARLLFGETSPRLADPRLEALRRLAVLAWHDGPAPSAEAAADLIDAGFTPAQLAAIHEYISAAQQPASGTVAPL